MADTLRTADLLTIGQVAARGGIAASALRFYESMGLLHDQRETPEDLVPTGQRRYLRDTLRRVAFIRAAQEVGLSLEDIRVALDALPTDRNATEAEWQLVAERWRPMLDARMKLLERLRADKGKCIGCGCLALADCKKQNPDDIAYEIGHSAQYLLGRTKADALAAQAKTRAKRSR